MTSPVPARSVEPGGTVGPTFLFLHVMKTGGTSLLFHLLDNFGPGEIEPDHRERPRDEPVPADYASLTRLWALTPERRARLRVVAGHYPYWVRELVEPDVTITVLRDPVERTISLLRQLRGEERGDDRRSLEELYDDPVVRRTLVQDYQAKVFGMSRADWEAAAAFVRALSPDRTDAGHLAHLVALDVDAERTARAKANLATVEVVGVQHRYSEFLDELRERFGWHVPVERRLRRAEGEVAVPDSLRRRIAAENPADMELWAFATALVDERSRDR